MTSVHLVPLVQISFVLGAGTALLLIVFARWCTWLPSPQVSRARGWSTWLPSPHRLEKHVDGARCSRTSRLASESVSGARGSHPPRLAEHVGGTCGSLLLILIIAVWSKWLPSTQVRRVHSPKTGIGWQLTDTYLTALPTGKSPPPPTPVQYSV